jgi:hypothetical protein
MARQVVPFEVPTRPNPDIYQGADIDGPLMGNGDVGVVVVGTSDALRLKIGKNDFWDTRRGGVWVDPKSQPAPAKLKGPTKGMYPQGDWRIDPRYLRPGAANANLNCAGPPTPKPVGQVNLLIPALKDASFHQEQDLLRAEVRSVFTKGPLRVCLTMWLSATDNTLVILLSHNGSEPLPVEMQLYRHRDTIDTSIEDAQSGTRGDLFWVSQLLPCSPAMPAGLEAAVVARVLNAETRPAIAPLTATAAFLVPSEKTVIAVVHVLSSLDVPSDHADGTRQAGAALRAAQKATARLSTKTVAKLSRRHRAWWRRFWSASFVELGDKAAEEYYYANQYILGCANRKGKAAPGLYGPWITCDYPVWNGDYHLNYNFQQPYYGIYASNHPELGWPYYDLMVSLAKRAEFLARRDGFRGLRYPSVAYAHDPDFNYGDGTDMGQKSITAWVMQAFIWHWRYTGDDGFIRQYYPILRGCAEYYEAFIRRDSRGRYVIPNSQPQEGSVTDAAGQRLTTNAIIDLALVRYLLRGLVDISAALNVDADRRAAWETILANLSAYPTAELDFGPKVGKQTVFVDMEGARGWQGVYPGSLFPMFSGDDVGLGSPPELLQIGLNTSRYVTARPDNRFVLMPTAAARVGRRDALDMLKADITGRAYRNRSVDCFPVGQGQSGQNGYGVWIENAALTAPINEMLLQSYDGTIRLFPAWPLDKPARFGTLRAVGAFLVSGALVDRKAAYVVIKSEKGKPCAVANPWPGCAVAVTELADPGRTPTALEQHGSVLCFPTRPGRTYRLSPLAVSPN